MQLKKNQPEFELVDGLNAGTQFKHGQNYELKDIPKEYRNRFEKPKAAKKSGTEAQGGKKK